MMTYTIAEHVLSHPNSPPDLTHTGSKSSKSSSFHSSYHGDDHTDIGNFEDIGLDDDTTTADNFIVKSSASLPAFHPSNPSFTHDFRPLNRSKSRPGKTSAPSAVKNRELMHPRSSSAQHQPPYMRGPPKRSVTIDYSMSTKGLALAPAGPPSSMMGRRGFSGSTLSLTSMGNGPSSSLRSRTPSPSFPSFQHHSMRNRSPNPPRLSSRRSSSNTTEGRERKSVHDLERECDEEDDDEGVPDECFLENVPISPRPPIKRRKSTNDRVSPEPDSRERASPGGKKSKAKTVGNGTPAIPVAQGSLRSPVPRSPSFHNLQNGEKISVGQFPIHDGKPRTKSWNEALSDLSSEAKALTEKLEEHAEELESQPALHSPYQRHSMNTPGSPHPDYFVKPRVKSAIAELPPLRRTNIMIDPLPISKEKEAVLSRTRPSWLPPKDPAEEKRHLKEYQRMMEMSQVADKKREEAVKTKLVHKDETVDVLSRIWEQHVLPNWDVATKQRRFREMWWKGIVPRSRGEVWVRAVGNDLSLTEASYQAATKRASELRRKLANAEQTSLSDEDRRLANSFAKIDKAAAETFPELGLFRQNVAPGGVDGPLFEGLREVLYAYCAYRRDIGFMEGTNTIAALLLLNLPSPCQTFIALCNILNRPLPLSFHTHDGAAKSRIYALTLSTLQTKSPRLHHRLQTLHLDPSQWLDRLYRGLFTDCLDLDKATRLWDVYVFEGDSVVVRGAVALLCSFEGKLLGAQSAREVLEVLKKGTKRGDGKARGGLECDEDEWMRRVRDAGKEGRGA